MGEADRTFLAEVETVYHKDYQCDYYRGVVIDGDNNIVSRCRELHPTYDKAKRDAERKILDSPLYAKKTSPELKAKLEAYKKQKEAFEKNTAVYVYNPGEWNQWLYMYDDGLYRFRYTNQNDALSSSTARWGMPLTSILLNRKGESDRAFYLSRVDCISDIEHLPGHKDIWSIDRVKKIVHKKNGNAAVTIVYRVYGNLREDFREREHTKTITIKRKWECFDDLLERFENICY